VPAARKERLGKAFPNFSRRPLIWVILNALKSALGLSADRGWRTVLGAIKQELHLEDLEEEISK